MPEDFQNVVQYLLCSKSIAFYYGTRDAASRLSIRELRFGPAAVRLTTFVRRRKNASVCMLRVRMPPLLPPPSTRLLRRSCLFCGLLFNVERLKIDDDEGKEVNFNVNTLPTYIT